MAQDDGFLARWSRRKLQARQGEVPADAPAPVAAPLPTAVAAPAALEQLTPQSPSAQPAAHTAAPKPPPPTLADVETLTHESDFARFVAPEVGGEVRNAALKKLFSDPHFNVMDGLDTYIDDYNTPDPLPKAMLRQMAQAAYLGLVEPEPAKPPAETPSGPQHAQAQGHPPSPEPPETSVAGHAPAAMSPAAVSDAAAMEAHDEDPDLRLQPHHDPGPPGAGAGAGEDARRQR